MSSCQSVAVIGADILDNTGQNAFSFGRLRIQPIATPGRGNHNFEGRSYLLSWREEGRPRYSWAQAREFCSSAGMRLLSLDTAAKLDHFLGLAATQVRSDQART